MRGLSRESVARTALALADLNGVDGISLRQIASELGVTPMALYRYVDGKDDLLDATADLLYAKLWTPTDSGEWWYNLAALARSTRKVAAAHVSARDFFSRPSSGPHAHQVSDAVAANLRDAGFLEREIAELHEQLTAMVFALTAASRTNAAFERGLELIHAGLEARRRARAAPTGDR
jgi:AcrR family transcriptional regulator